MKQIGSFCFFILFCIVPIAGKSQCKAISDLVAVLDGNKNLDGYDFNYINNIKIKGYELPIQGKVYNFLNNDKLYVSKNEYCILVTSSACYREIKSDVAKEQGARVDSKSLLTFGDYNVEQYKHLNRDLIFEFHSNNSEDLLSIVLMNSETLTMIDNFIIKAQGTKNLELLNQKKSQIESDIINLKSTKRNELEHKNEEIKSFQVNLNQKKVEYNSLLDNKNEKVRELNNYKANEVKLSLYNNFQNVVFYKPTDLEKDIDKFYNLIQEVNQLPIGSRYLILDNAIIYKYTTDVEGYISSYDKLNVSDQIQKKYNKLKEKGRLLPVNDTKIELYRLSGINNHYFELKNEIQTLEKDISQLQVSLDLLNKRIPDLKEEYQRLDGQWSNKINQKESELSQIEIKIKSLDFQSVKIGDQIWMAENLNVAYFQNGDEIPEAKTDEEWKRAGERGEPAWCYYDNDPANGEKYGKLYNWYAVNDSRGLAPVGYHIPSDAEWTELEDFLGTDAGKKMKSTSGWNSDGNGNNESGFSGLPGGDRNNDGSFLNVGDYGCWWSSSESSTYDVWYRYLSYAYGDVFRYGFSKVKGFSVRCLRD